MLQEATPFLVAVLSFAAVAAVVVVLGRLIVTQASVQRRLSASGSTLGTASDPSATAVRPVADWIVRTFDEKKFGFDSGLRAKLRRDLVRAGFFRIGRSSTTSS